MTYAPQHAMALGKVSARGAAITFSRTTVTYTASDDTSTVAVTSVAGYAVQVRGNPQRYALLGLVLETALTLFFTPTTRGEVPRPGDVGTWNSLSYTVKDVDPIAPNGTVIAARVTVSR